jgi:DMSO/TMAO reductase YedYZ molybdopterin-dependent catalytic subunit
MWHADEDAAARGRMRSGGGIAHPETVTERPAGRRGPHCCLQQDLTPNGQFFVRNHFDTLRLHPKTYLLVVEDIGRRATNFTLAMLERLPERRVIAVLECAGNGGARWCSGPWGTVRWAARRGRASRSATY